MAKHTKTLLLVEAAQAILAEHHPMTVRQCYYQLVSSQVIKNNRGQYQAVSKALVDARREGIIPWEWIEDRLRRPRTVSMWDDLQDFAQTALASYRRDVWASQPAYVEVWVRSRTRQQRAQTSSRSTASRTWSRIWNHSCTSSRFSLMAAYLQIRQPVCFFDTGGPGTP